MANHSFIGIKRWGLKQLQSSAAKELNMPHLEKKRSNLENVFVTIIIMYVLFVLIAVPALNYIGGIMNLEISLGIVLLVFGFFSIYYAFKVYLYYLFIKNTPVSMIETSGDRLNEFTVNFVPEAGEPLVSPVSKQKCVYFEFEEHEVMGNGRETRDLVTASATKAVPALLTDGTGYLAADFSKAELDTVTKRYRPVFKNVSRTALEEGIDRVRNEMQSMQNMKLGDYDAMHEIWEKEQEKNLKMMTDGVEFVEGEGVGTLSQDRAGSVLPPRSVYFVEYTIPLTTDYFALGQVKEINRRMGKKPVKYLYADPNYSLFSILLKDKSTWAKRDAKTYLSLFAFGFINVIVGITLVMQLIAMV